MAQDHHRLRNGKEIRAFRSFDRESDLLRKMANLSIIFAGTAELHRALRQARRAARAGERGYDPARHAALLRLASGSTARNQREQRHGATNVG